MAKTDWQMGDVVTANELNDIGTTINSVDARTTRAVCLTVGPVSHDLDDKNWTYDSVTDRYYQDVACAGITADIIPCINADNMGGNFALIACDSLDGAVRVYVHDIPTISALVTIYGLAVRA